MLKHEAANSGKRSVANSMPLAENLSGTALENRAFINYVADVLGQPQPALRQRLAHDINNIPVPIACSNPSCMRRRNDTPREDHQTLIDPHGIHGSTFALKDFAHEQVVKT